MRACPESGVLELVHGQALVAHGARCIGHASCKSACPVGAIALTPGERARHAVPALTHTLEARGQAGLFLAGEVTGYALIRSAIVQGIAVADQVAQRVRRDRGADTALDLVIVGAGPAGLACALQAKSHGLSFVVLEQDQLGGAVARYPRRKLVLTQSVDLPLAGRLEQRTYEKEQLIELWRGIARRFELPIRAGQSFEGLARRDDGSFVVHTSGGVIAASNVCLSIGRRGVPNRLGVAGEELRKVAYDLIDAHAYTGRRILVVGGGDSAVEAALGLAEQPGNEVTLAHRREHFTRLEPSNLARLEHSRTSGRVRVFTRSVVERIDEDSVELRVDESGSPARLANDDVFVFAGGAPAVSLLERCGVAFEPPDVQQDSAPVERGTGLLRALIVALALTLAATAWALALRGYYGLAPAQRAASELHALLRPGGTLGLALGIASLAALASCLAYVARAKNWLERGALPAWLTFHMLAGVGAFVFALLHSAMDLRSSTGGHALAALALLVVTGAIGRYFYAFAPRAASNHEHALLELNARLARSSAQWDSTDRAFGPRVRAEVERLTGARTWRRSLLARIAALVAGQRELRRTLDALRRQGLAEGVAPGHLDELLELARGAHRTALMAAHYDDLRALMSSWRYLHRWLAVLTLLLVLLHVAVALRFGTKLFEAAP